MTTQWRTDFNGRLGLDYNTLPTVFRLTGVPRSEWAALFEDMRVMEGEALTALREGRD